jgi:predicted transcriptional regulator/DNA-binding XRE family transcriptional regulator
MSTHTLPRTQSKIRLGPKIRRLRRDNRLSQAKLAEQLGISPSYLNLIEHNRRNVTVDLLLKLAEQFQLAIGDLSEDDDGQVMADLVETFDDDIFERHDLTTTEVRELVTAAPVVAQAVLTLYDAYRNTRAEASTLADQFSEETDASLDGESRIPTDQVSDFIQQSANHFADIEEEAERIRREAGLESGDPLAKLIDYLKTTHGVRVAILPPEPGQATARRYDAAARTLEISETLARGSRIFQIANQIGLLAASPVFDTLLQEGRLQSGEAQTLGRIALANYFAGAVMMPYAPFLEAAQSLRYDIDLLQHHFGANFEQVCHRLTTLQRPGARGVPFHMLRVDIAGNVSKRFSASGLRIPRHGGACPRWNVYTAFLSPGMINAQISRMPDGASYFCIARTVQKRMGGYGEPQRILSIGLGCQLSEARALVYADGMDLDDPRRAIAAGGQCRSCDRMDCRQRAFPPVHHRLNLNENVRGLSAYVSPPRGG